MWCYGGGDDDGDNGDRNDNSGDGGGDDRGSVGCGGGDSGSTHLCSGKKKKVLVVSKVAMVTMKFGVML